MEVPPPPIGIGAWLVTADNCGYSTIRSYSNLTRYLSRNNAHYINATATYNLQLTTATRTSTTLTTSL